MIRSARVVPFASILFASCALFSGRCIYEIRSLQGAGHVDELGSPLVTAEVTVSEQRDSDPQKDIHWLIMSPTLKGHILSAVLKDAADPSHVLLNLDIADQNRPVISENAVSTQNGATLNGFFEMFAAGRGVIELQTDLSSRPTITIPISVVSKSDWTRPYCS